jgi:hypothetical protein
VRRSGTILLALLVLVLATPAGATARPGLRVVNKGSGLAIAGRGFKAMERVHVKVATRSVSTSKRVRAGRRGRFTVRFHLPFGGCGPGYVVIARGSLGSRARLELAPPPCPPPSPVEG